MKFICGPSLIDIQMFKHIEKNIKQYIAKNSMPKQLEDINNFSYKLKRCEKIDLDTTNKIETCSFVNNYQIYNISLTYKKSNDKTETLYISVDNPSSKTIGLFVYKLDPRTRNISSKISFESADVSGICNPMQPIDTSWFIEWLRKE